jgi:hypothetical protein
MGISFTSSSNEAARNRHAARRSRSGPVATVRRRVHEFRHDRLETDVVQKRERRLGRVGIVEELLAEHGVDEGGVGGAADGQHEAAAGLEVPGDRHENRPVVCALDVEKRVPADRARVDPVEHERLEVAVLPTCGGKASARDREHAVRLIDADDAMAARQHMLGDRPARAAAEVEDARRGRQAVEHQVDVLALATVEGPPRLVPRGGDAIVRASVQTAAFVRTGVRGAHAEALRHQSLYQGFLPASATPSGNRCGTVFAPSTNP